jgi:hypothetical protein
MSILLFFLSQVETLKIFIAALFKTAHRLNANGGQGKFLMFIS